jgi:hypothetical protein
MTKENDPRSDARLSQLFAAHRKLLFPTGLKSPSVQENELLGDLQIDLDLEDDELAGRVHSWLERRKVPEAIVLDDTVDERMYAPAVTALDPHIRQRAQAFRQSHIELAHALSSATGVPISDRTRRKRPNG